VPPISIIYYGLHSAPTTPCGVKNKFSNCVVCSKLLVSSNYYKLQVYNNTTEHAQLQVIIVYCLLFSANCITHYTSPAADNSSSLPVSCSSVQPFVSRRFRLSDLSVPIYFSSFTNDSIPAPIDTHFCRHDAPAVKFHR